MSKVEEMNINKKIKEYIKKTKIFHFILSYFNLFRYLNKLAKNSNLNNYRETGKSSQVGIPFIGKTQQVQMMDYSRIQNGANFVANYGRFVLGKYSAVGSEILIVPGNHTPTVGVPQYLSYLGINDVNHTIKVEEDVWIGSRVILLYNSKISRGAVIGAGSLVTKEVPPYAVVVGSPAKIIAVKFSKEEILKHESILYPEEDRFSREYLDDLFEKYYNNLSSIGTSFISESDKEKLDRIKEEKGIKEYCG